MRKIFLKGCSLFLTVCIAAGMLSFSSLPVTAAKGTETFTGGGVTWSVYHDIAYTTMSAAKDGGLLITNQAGANTANSSIAVVSESVFPVQDMKFDVQCSYGSLDNSAYFGIKDVSGTRQFLVRRMVSGTTARIRIIVDGEAVDILTVTGQLRTRIFEVGVVKSGESWYLTYDGRTIDAADCSEAVQEAVKLENTFPKALLEGNGLVKFTFGASSMNGWAYCHARLAYTDGVLLPSVTSYGDRNAGTTTNGRTGCADDLIRSVTIAPAAVSAISGGQTLTFDGEASTAAILAAPNGNDVSFTLSMSNRSDANQWINLTLSNDPLFREDSAKVAFSIVKYPDGLDGVYYNGEVTSHFSGLFDGTTVWQYRLAETENDSGVFRFALTNSSEQEYIASDPDFAAVAAGPLYLRLETSEVMTMKVWFDQPSAVTMPSQAAQNNLVACKKALVDFYDSADRFSSKENGMTAAAFSFAYDDACRTLASNVKTRLAALPAVSSLTVSNKETVLQVVSDYYALDTVYRAGMDAAKIEQYRTAAQTLYGSGTYVTQNGEVYETNYNSSYITLSSDSHGTLIATPTAGENTENTAFYAMTQAAYPMLTSTYALSHYFGTIGTSRFGLTASADGVAAAETLQAEDHIIIYRTMLGNSTTQFQVKLNDTDGTIEECGILANTARNVFADIQVVYQGGYHYLSWGGFVLDGEGYSEEVQEYLKLENHFQPEFFSQNLPVHFLFGSECLYGSVYCLSNSRTGEGAHVNSIFTRYPGNNLYAGVRTFYESTNTISENDLGHTRFDMTLQRNSDVLLQAPVTASGFTVKATMTKSSTKDQPVHVVFSNDSSFTDETVTVDLIRVGKTSAFRAELDSVTVATDTQNFFSDTPYTFTFVRQADNKTFLLLRAAGGKVMTVPYDFSELLSKPLYMKLSYTSTTDCLPNLQITLNDHGIGFQSSRSVDLCVPKTFSTSDLFAAENQLTTYFAQAYHAASMLSDLKAIAYLNDLATESREQVDAADIDDLIAMTAAAPTAYYLNRSYITTIKTAYTGFTDRQKSMCGESTGEMIAYFDALVPANNATLSALKNAVAGTQQLETEKYDFYYDHELNQLDVDRLETVLRLGNNRGDADENDPYFAEQDQADSNTSSAVTPGTPVTLYASDFGVVGDGTTDDGPAIEALMAALNNSPDGSSAVFTNATYYIGSLSGSALFDLNGCKNMTVNANGSTFVLGILRNYLTAANTRNCTVKNAVFKLKRSPAFRATTLSVNTTSHYADFQTSFDLGLENGESWAGPEASRFAALDRSVSRFHMFFSRIQMLDKSAGKFRIYFVDQAQTYSLMKYDLKTYGILCPTPYVARVWERAFTIADNTDFTMEDVTVRHCSKFGMYIGRNEGTLRFTNVDFTPEETTPSGKATFTSWCDTFHVKDNRSKIIWQNCDITGNFDDMFNISSSVLYVSNYLPESRMMTLKWQESSDGLYYPIQAGDELHVINTSTGYDCGTVVVEKVFLQKNGRNIIRVSPGLHDYGSLGTSVEASFLNRCAPGSEVKNCTLNGTFRARGPITFQGCSIYNMRIWLDYNQGIEGPVPTGITFRNCNISFGTNATIVIKSYNPGSLGAKGYHVSDITFDSCTMNNAFDKSTEDWKYVTVKNCKTSSGSSISDHTGLGSTKIQITDMQKISGSSGYQFLLKLTNKKGNAITDVSSGIALKKNGTAMSGTLTHLGSGVYAYRTSSALGSGEHMLIAEIDNSSYAYSQSESVAATDAALLYQTCDLVLLKRKLLGNAVTMERAEDVNRDNVVDIRDLVRLKKMFADF